jgi:hypothetical protein
MKSPDLTEAEWRYVQEVIGQIASEDARDYMADAIRTKLYLAMGVG